MKLDHPVGPGRWRVVWLCQGLADDVTGIERFALKLFDRLVEERVIQPQELCVVAEPGARWAHSLQDSGVTVVSRATKRWKRPGREFDGTHVTHGFGGSLFPRRASGRRGRRIYSVYDWGPFSDPELDARARIAWRYVMRRGWRDADVVHLLNNSLLDGIPKGWKPAPRAVVAYPDSELSHLDAEWQLAAMSPSKHGLFIGTAAARKRLPQLANMAEASACELWFMGAGTDAFDARPFVRGFGRVDHEEVVQALEQAAYVVLTSDYEGFGLPVLEGAVRGIRSVVSPEVHAVLPPDLKDYAYPVRPGDVASFLQARQAAILARGTSRYDAHGLLEPLAREYMSALA